jgi:hypothetical protein
VGQLELVKTFPITGVGALGSTGTLDVSATVSLTSGWGTNAWGADGWGEGYLAPTLGNVGNVFVAPPLSGVEASWSIGQFGFEKSFPLTGAGASGSTGSLSVDSTVAISTGGWGTDTWGSEGWGEGYSAPTFGNVGNVFVAPPIFGVEAFGDVGQLEFGKTFPLTSASATGSVDTFAVDSTVSLASGWGTGAWGSDGWGEGYFAPAIGSIGIIGIASPILGVEASGTVGQLEFEKAFPLTGVDAFGSVDTVTANSDVAVSSVAALGSLGTISYAPPLSGVEASWDIGQLEIEKSFALTSASATGSVNTFAVDFTVAISTGGWGDGPWGDKPWGENYFDPILGSVGDVIRSPELLGVETSGTVGQLEYEKTFPITGVTASGLTNTLDVSSTVAISTGGWGDGLWGENPWGENYFEPILGSVGNVFVAPPLSGVETSGSVADLAIEYSYALTGVTASGSTGVFEVSSTVAISTSGWGGGLWGADGWGENNSGSVLGDVGQLFVAPPLYGVEALGNEKVFGWGAGSWDSGSWGETESEQALIPSTEVTLTGVAATGEVDKPEANITVALEDGWGQNSWGSDIWGGGQGLLITGEVEGFIPKLTNVLATGNVGDLSNGLSIELTSVSLTANLGTIAPLFFVVGVQAAGSVGILGVKKTFWNVIDDSQNANWILVPDEQVANWLSINDAQSANWVVVPNPQMPGWAWIGNPQTADWQSVVDTQSPNWSTLASAQSANWGTVPNTQAAGWSQVSNALTVDWQLISTSQSSGWGNTITEQDADWHEVTT